MSSINVLFIPLDSWGHINACIGIAEKLVTLGHRVTFALESAWRGQLDKRGFNEVIYIDPSRNPEHGPNDHWIESIRMIEDTLHQDSLYKVKHQNLDEFEEFIFNVLGFNDRLAEIIDELSPEVIIIDHYFTVPAVYNCKRKWIYMTSAAPLSAIQHENTPPTGSGYPVDGDRNQWAVFDQINEERYGPLIKKFEKELIELGIPKLPPGSMFHPSPYLNMYPYPIELDYLDLRPLPEKWRRFDHFIRSTQNNSQSLFKLPDKLKNMPGKLIFVSMGSLGSAHLKLLKRLIDILGSSEHRYLLVMGPNHGLLQLPDNIYGAQMLPQLSILPMVDLVITHGGNNTVLESLYYGKPMIINPMFYDQYDNAQRVTEKGFGHRINLYECSPEELLLLIEQTLADPKMNQRCQQVSKRMQSSNSTEMAAKAIVDTALMD